MYMEMERSGLLLYGAEAAGIACDFKKERRSEMSNLSEPVTMALLGSVLLVLAGLRRKFRKR
jgi:hypothetical protein